MKETKEQEEKRQMSNLNKGRRLGLSLSQKYVSTGSLYEIFQDKHYKSILYFFRDGKFIRTILFTELLALAKQGAKPK